MKRNVMLTPIVLKMGDAMMRNEKRNVSDPFGTLRSRRWRYGEFDANRSATNDVQERVAA